MAEGHNDQGTNNAQMYDHAVDGQGTVELAYRPQSADALVGIKVRERIKWIGLLLRGAALFLVVGTWLQSAVILGSVDVISTALLLLIVLLLWGYPRLQAALVQRLVGWQGEYRTTVSPAGITCRTDHATLTQKWSIFQGYRETPGHFVLLSRDPNIMVVDILPKRGVHEPGDIERLRAILDQHTPRV